MKRVHSFSYYTTSNMSASGLCFAYFFDKPITLKSKEYYTFELTLSCFEPEFDD